MYMELCNTNNNFYLFYYETCHKDSIHPENKDNVIKKLNDKINKSVIDNASLFCTGYYLPDIKINKEITQSVYFNGCKFQLTNFSKATFSDIVDFSDTKFSMRQLHDSLFC